MVFGEQHATFRELDGAANALANALIGYGLTPGDRIAMLLGSGIDLVIALFAASKAGAASVMMNPRWTRTELRSAFAATGPKAVIATQSEMLAHTDLPDLCISASSLDVEGWTRLWDLIATGHGRRPDVLVPDWLELEAVLPFSSGTTGLPKAAIHTHGSIVAATLQWKAAGAMRSSDRMLLFLPIFHVYGLITLAAAIASRARLTLMERFDAHEVLDIIEREQSTMTFGAAPVAIALADVPDLETRDLSSLRYVCWGATPMDVHLADEVTRRSGIRWLHAYGATEAPLLHCNPVDHSEQWRLDSPGLPVSDLEVKIVDLATRQPVPSGTTGEVLVRGPQLIRGYLPSRDDDDPFEDGWLRTGDIGWVEDAGWIHLVDRAKEMIKVNAFQVAPAELESVLLSHPAVADCGVFGVPDRRTGEAPVAAVSLELSQADVTAEELVAWVAGRVARYKRVRQVMTTDHIPRTASGKVLRRELKARWLEAGSMQHPSGPGVSGQE